MKTQSTNNQIGLQRMATVNSNLTTDPYNKRGKTGRIIDIDEDVVTLEFSDGTTGKYMENAIEVL